MRRLLYEFKEILQRAAQHPGADPLAVRTVYGAVRHGEPAESADFNAHTAGAFAADEDVPTITLASLVAPYLQRAANFAFLRNHSAARLYLDFSTGGTAEDLDDTSTADITPYRIEANGNITRGTPITGLAHRVEVRDAEVAGRVTLYQLTNINPSGAQDGLKLYVAGEGAAYVIEAP